MNEETEITLNQKIIALMFLILLTGLAILGAGIAVYEVFIPHEPIYDRMNVFCETGYERIGTLVAPRFFCNEKEFVCGKNDCWYISDLNE